jgi:DNA-binding response OmpR family regulator
MNLQIGKSNIKVLVVDDDPVIRQMFCSFLAGEGCQVKTATDGEEAVEVALTFMPDLIFLDVIMPNMDGLQTLTRLRKMDKTKKVPVIIITARTDSATLMEAIRTGANDFITKPFLRGDLTRKMNYVLMNRREQKKTTDATLMPDSSILMGGKSYEKMRENFILNFENVYLTILKLISQRNQKELEMVITRLLDSVKFYQLKEIKGPVFQMLLAVSTARWDLAIELLENIYSLFHDLRTSIPRVLQ